MNKKFIALFLAFALMFSTLTIAFANTTISDEAAIAEAIGMLKGEGNGVTPEYLATQPTRLQAAIMYLRLRGLEEEALAWTGTANFPDGENYVWEGGEAIMAYLKSHPELGWQGADGMFLPNAKINAQSFYKVMLEALGYKQNSVDVIGDFTWAGTFNFAADLGMVSVADVTNFTVNDLAIATLEALVIPVKNSEMTLIATLVEAGIIDMETAILVGLYEDPATVELENAITAAEEAIAALPAVVTLAHKAHVEVARALVDAVAALDAEAVIENIAVLEAAEAVIVELEEAAADAEAREAAKAALEAAMKSVSAIANNKIQITLSEAITSVEVSSFEVKNAANNAIEVKSATLSADGKTVTLVTEAQVPYTVYSVKVNNKSMQYVAVMTDSVKPTATAVVDGYNRVKITFNEAVDKAMAENIANYTIDNNLTVLKAALNETGTVVILTTAQQVVGTIYKITVQNVADVSGNVMDKYEVLFGGMAKDTTKPTATAVVIANNMVRVTFSEVVDKEMAENIANYAIDNGLTVLKAELNTAGTIVILTTSEQAVGTIYKITVQNVADIDGNVMDKYETLFGGMAKDTTKPTVLSATVSTNTKITVTFDKAMDKVVAENIANYTVDNGLVVLKAELNAAGTVVTLTTSEQTVGTIYKVTVQNVADISGNVMDKYEALFGGMAKDTIKPTATVATAANTVTVTFSKDMDAVTATNVLNYVFDGNLGYATKATLDATNRIVTLTTASQTPGKIYNVTINGVQDISGNAIAADTKIAFVGVGSVAASQVTLQAISIVNENTVDLIFDRELTATDVTNLVMTIDEDNNAVYVNPVGLAYAKFQQANKNIVRVQFRTATANPALFEAGHVYKATITGIANLITANSANVKAFAGTNVTNPIPYVMTATAQNNTAIKVTFSEPVTNVTAAAFTITPARTITGVSVQAADVVTEAIIYLDSATALATSTVYELTFNAGVTDAAGYNAMRILNADATAYKVQFAGTNVANTAPKMSVVIPIDRYTFDVYFTEAVILGNASFGVVKVSGTGNNLNLAGATYTQSADKTKLTVSLDAATVALVSGTVYELTITPGTLSDLQGETYDATLNANKVQFGGVDTVNALPVISAVSINAANNEITVVFNETIIASGLDMTYFTITGADFTAGVDTAVLQADGRTVVITLEHTLTTGQFATIRLSATGLAGVTDINNQAPSALVDAIQFGTR